MGCATVAISHIPTLAAAILWLKSISLYSTLSQVHVCKEWGQKNGREPPNQPKENRAVDPEDGDDEGNGSNNTLIRQSEMALFARKRAGGSVDENTQGPWRQRYLRVCSDEQCPAAIKNTH